MADDLPTGAAVSSPIADGLLGKVPMKCRRGASARTEGERPRAACTAEPHEQGDGEVRLSAAIKPENRSVDPQAELRARWIAMCKRGDHLHTDLAPFADLKCGAKSKRTGLPCPHTSVYANGRCRWHGGLSIGPKTAAGKAKAQANLPRRADVGTKPHEDLTKADVQRVTTKHGAVVSVGEAPGVFGGPNGSATNPNGKHWRGKASA